MKKKLTHFVKLALAALSLGAPLGAQAGYTPIALTGFTADIVANGAGAVNTTTTHDIDGSGTGYCLMAQDYVGPNGQVPQTANPALPNSGAFNSALNAALPFQLASYSANNTLRLTGANATGTLTFVTPQRAGELYILGTSGNAPSSLTITVNFTDGNTQQFTGQSIADWFAGNQTNVALQRLGRVSRDDNSVQYINGNGSIVGPRLYQVRLALLAANYAKNISSITFLKPAAAGNAMIMAVTANSACAGTPTAGTTVAGVSSACPSTSIALSLSGADTDIGLTYQWQSFIAGGSGWANINGATSATYTATGQADATQYRAVLTCTSSGQSGTSAPVSVAQNPFYNCYCANVSTGTNEYIRSVSVNGASGFTKTTNANSTNGYGDFTTDPSLTTTLSKGGNYPLSVTVQANNNGSQGGYWIDYDQNGVFDSGEYTEFGRSNLSGQAVTFNSFLTIPNTSAVRTGLTRLRVRWRNGAVAATDACTSGSTSWYGETEDYLVTIGPSTACTTPPRVTAVANQTSVCPNTPISLTVTGLTAASGFAFQWQSSPAGANNYTNLGGVQTTPTYTVTSQTAATDYRLVVTCTGSGLSRIGTEVTVAQNNFLTCYCTPTHSTGCGTYAGLLRVAIPGTGLDNTTTCAGAPYYSNVPPTTASGTMNLGTSYPMSVTLGRYAKAGLWIDYDHSGTFDASEYLAIGSNSGNTTGSTAVVTPTLVIPGTALTGATRMRVRTQYFLATATYPLTATDACTGFAYGETEDYTINLVNPTPCAGVPAASTATASVTAACSTATFTLGLTGLDPALTGLSYQWQSSPAGQNSFTNLGAAQSTPLYSVTGLTADTDYRAVVTCTNGGASSTSGSVRVNNGYLSCYCIPQSGSTNEYITNVTLPGLNGFSNSTTNTGSSPAGFNDYTNNASLTTTVYRGVPYLNGLSVSVRSNNTDSQGGLWIDYNHNGVFDDTEFILLGSSSAIATIVTFTQTLTVPLTAQLGPTRVRVRWRNGNFTSTPATAPCLSGTTSWYGETEDYLITIADAPTCTAPPATVTATASVASACANGSFSLSTNSVSTALGGYTFQWMSRPVGSRGAFTDIIGASSNPYTITGQTEATEYRLVVSCQYGGAPTASNTVTVSQNTFDQCYCATSSTNGCATYGSITNVRLGAINNSTGCAASTFTVFAPSATTTTALDMGTSMPLTLTIGGTNTYRYAVWIDFNQNGIFESSEYLASSTPIGTRPLTVNLAIPLPSGTVLTGTTRMRIRTNSGIAAYPNFSASDACSVTYDGETEDYTVTLLPPTPCAGTPPTVAAAASTASACATASFTLSFPSPGNLTGLSYQWESSPAGAGTFAAIAGATATTYTVSGQTAATDYRVVLTCATGGLTAASMPVSVAQSALADCYCKPTSSSVGEYFTNVTLGSINNPTGNSVASPISGYSDYTVSPTPTQTTSLVRGSTYTISVTAVDNRINSQALLWIDYNQNGVFESAEYTLVGNGPTTGTFPQTLNFMKSFTVPATAPTGPTRLRLRWHNDNNSTDPCALGWNGETEDYTVNIIDADLVVSTTMPIPAGAYNSITITGTGNGTLAGASSVATGLTVEAGGTFADGCQVLSGAGAFTAAPGSTLRICNPAGISASGATGAVQVTGLRSFSPLASYEYNGTAAQVTGSGLPATVLNLNVNNAAHVGLTQNTAVRRMLTLAAGDLNLGASNLALTSTDTLTAMVVNTGGAVQNTGSGVAIMQRYATPSTGYSGPGYRHYSSPMTATPISELGTNTFVPLVNPAYNALPTPNLPLAQFPNVFDYQESRLTAAYPGFDIGWHSPGATTDVLTPGKGYTVNLAPQLVDLSGRLNTGPVPTGALTHSGGANAGWQLLGNPYPAPLDWSLVSGLPAGVDASVYVFEPSSQYGGFYRSFVNGVGTNSFNGVLPAMQAFFVRTTQAVPGGFSFQNAHRLTSYANPAFHRSTADTRPLLRLTLGGSAGTDETIVYLQAGATAGTDRAFDAAKLPNSSGLSLATQLPGTDALAISGLPLTVATAETFLPLAVGVPAAGTYRFEVALTNFDPATEVLLIDHARNTRTNLRQVPGYTFSTAQAGTLPGRFELLLGRPNVVTATAATAASQFSVWPNPATDKAALHLSLEAPATQATLTLRTVLGQVVRTQTFGGAAATLPTTGLAPGTYLLTVQVAGQAPATRRVVVE